MNGWNFNYRWQNAKSWFQTSYTLSRSEDQGFDPLKGGISLPPDSDNIDAEIGAHMLYTTNRDVPGIIGTLGQTMGENGVNIANFTLGRSDRGGDAIALLYVDEAIPAPVLAKLAATGMFQSVAPLEFNVS